MAHMDGSGPGTDTNVVPFALARLERLIQVRLAESLDIGDEPAISVKVYDADAADAGRAPAIPDDPRFYDAVIDKIVETLDEYLDDVGNGTKLSADALNEEVENAFVGLAPRACDIFVGRLRCMSCGIVTRDETAACETFLRVRPTGATLRVGDRFELDPRNVAQDFYAHAMTPAPEEDVHIVEGWECPHCSGVNWAEVTLRDDRIASIWSVALSREVLSRAHYVSSECVELAARITGRPAWSLLGDDVFEILFDALEARS